MLTLPVLSADPRRWYSGKAIHNFLHSEEMWDAIGKQYITQQYTTLGLIVVTMGKWLHSVIYSLVPITFEEKSSKVQIQIHHFEKA